MSFGKVAVGCRIGKHPEAAFFAAWTGLIVQGMRTGDIVLSPSAHMPAHWAGDFLASQFMKSDCDSLLMIDDDMEFAPESLAAMRDKQANADYDIVFGLCTTREMPPKPVTLRRVDEERELYDRVYDFNEGDTIPVDTVGLAFTLIKRRVFEAFIHPNGLESTYFFAYGYGRETDETPFCRRARGYGFTMAVDTAVQIDHIAAIPLGWRHVPKVSNG